MWDQEKHHRETFERLIPEHRVRPTVLLPIWNIAGFALGKVILWRVMAEWLRAPDSCSGVSDQQSVD